MVEHKDIFTIKKMAKVLKVSTSGYYGWLDREASPRCIEDEMIYQDLYRLFRASRCSAGSRQLARKLSKLYGKPINRKKVQRLMREHGLVAKGKKKYINTTDSRNTVNFFPNVIDRDFHTEKVNTKMVSDTTYIYTKEGWLYLAGIMDLCSRKIVGMAVSSHNDTALVIAALDDLVNRVGKDKLEGCILHSDRGSTYASKEYIKKFQDLKMIGSMSRKGNCWDNAPIESFWGKMKVSWLKPVYETREEAIADIYEYIYVYYDKNHLHSANGYMTPDEYYKKKGA